MILSSRPCDLLHFEDLERRNHALQKASTSKSYTLTNYSLGPDYSRSLLRTHMVIHAELRSVLGYYARSKMESSRKAYQTGKRRTAPGLARSSMSAADGKHSNKYEY